VSARLGTVRVWRGGLLESEHAVAWCVAAEGDVLDAARPEDPGRSIVLRSTAKPLQALPAVRAGVLERFGLDERHLAVGCGSHSGSEEHVARVRELLRAAGCAERDLACGPSLPLNAALGAPRGRLRHNCSGKHALALALCVVERWPTAGYHDRTHPLQRAMRAAVGEGTGAPAEQLPGVTDGCGLSTWAVPLNGLATAFGRLGAGGLGEAGRRIAAAMRAEPVLVAYPGALDTELMLAEPGLVAKGGAEGVFAMGLPDGRGAALKILDGNARALGPAVVAVAREGLGLDVRAPALAAFAAPVLRNSRDEVVGRLTLA
jgi:L-asparaginase II